VRDFRRQADHLSHLCLSQVEAVEPDRSRVALVSPARRPRAAEGPKVEARAPQSVIPKRALAQAPSPLWMIPQKTFRQKTIRPLVLEQELFGASQESPANHPLSRMGREVARWSMDLVLLLGPSHGSMKAQIG
jgi:hypothetical protein